MTKRTPKILAANPQAEAAAPQPETKKAKRTRKAKKAEQHGPAIPEGWQAVDTSMPDTAQTTDAEGKTTQDAKAKPAVERVVPDRLRNASAASPDLLRAVLAKRGIGHEPDATRAELLAAGHGLVWGEYGNVVPEEHKARYGADQHCGDDVAEALVDHCRVPTGKGKATRLDMGLLNEVAEANGVSLKRWEHLNVGMVRMNLGNVLRGKAKRGEHVVIGAREWNKPEAQATA